MGSHPINLALRFILECCALISIGYWGWCLSDRWTRFLFALAIPIFVMALWVTFAVPDDPSRSGEAPIPVSGMVRLILELAIFTFATWTLYELGKVQWSWIFAGVVTAHYLASYDRIEWLLAQ